MTKSKKIIASLAAIAALAAALPAAAASNEKVQSKLVSYAGLDLGTQAGQDKLQRRIKYAVRVVCGFHEARTLRQIAHVQQCMKTAQAKADGNVRVAIARYHENRAIASNEIMVGN